MEQNEKISKHLALWEIISVLVSFLLAMWVVVPLGGGRAWLRIIPIGTALILIFLSHYVRGETARDIGWRTDNFNQALKILWLPTVSLMAIVLFLGWFFGSLRFNRSNLVTWSIWLLLWAVMQQYVLQGFFNRRTQIVFGKNWRNIVLVGILFGLLHLPNPFLSGATFVCGMLWAFVYQREPNLLVLTLAHAISSFTVACALPSAWTNSLRVGVKYFG